MSDLQDTVKLLRRAQQIAKRWVLGWGTSDDKGSYGYYDAQGVTVDIYPPHYIRFVPAIRDSMTNWHCWMDGKYLDDDTNLEHDAKVWYEGQMKRREAVTSREGQLRQFPEVQEFLSLVQRQYPIGVPRGDGWFTHPLYRDIQL